MLAGRGYDQVYNVAGGIEAWGSAVAVGDQTLGLELFEEIHSPVEVLKAAYSLEQGLRIFYLDMAEEQAVPEVRAMFNQLADIEIKHQDAIYETYADLVETPVTREVFESQVALKAMEGGRTTEEYLSAFSPELESETVVISLAMSIEAQALDLYMRAADLTVDERAREMFLKIANEEKTHLARLGELMDQVAAG